MDRKSIKKLKRENQEIRKLVNQLNNFKLKDVPYGVEDTYSYKQGMCKVLDSLNLILGKHLNI